MSENINPQKITKPLQLLAAWLVGLIAVNGSFLSAATLIKSPPWGASMLLIAAVCNVPLFIGCLFLLMTVFRPQIQDDQFYSKYLETKSPKNHPREKIDFSEKLEKQIGEIIPNMSDERKRIIEAIDKMEVERLAEKHSDNRTISEIHLFKDRWWQILKSYGNDPILKTEIDELVADGILSIKKGKEMHPELTDLGSRVALALESKNKLWNQEDGRPL